MVFGVLFYSYTYRWFQQRPGRWRIRILLNGLAFGGLAVILMIARIQVAPGVFMDARYVPVALIGLFEGWPTGVLAGVVSASYRVWQGGEGAPAGALGALAAGLAGGVVHLWARRDGNVGPLHTFTLCGIIFVITAATFLFLSSYTLELFGRIWWSLLLTYIVGIPLTARLLRDVVERVRFAVAQERFRAIIDEASDAIRIVDVDTSNIVEVNRRDCELSGYTRAQLIAHDSRDFWPTDPELRAAREAATAQAHQQGFARVFGLPYRTRTGQIITVDSTSRVVEHDGHRYEIAIFREAAEREAAEAARREAAELRAVTLLAGAAAHEINNPLAVIVASLELMGRRQSREATEGPGVEPALSAARRIRDIVRRMTRITRLESAPPQRNVPDMLDIRKSSEALKEDP